MLHRYDLDTAIEPADGTSVELRTETDATSSEAHYCGRIDPAWFITVGPNGGYIAALLLRAMTAAVGDETRKPRSLTVHYTAPPREGRVDLHTRIERQGKRLSTVSVRMEQEGRLLALALAAFSSERPAPGLLSPGPAAPAPEDTPALDRGGRAPLPFHQHFELRPCFGTPLFREGPEAHTGGWIRLAEPRALDPLLLATLADAWPPAIFTLLDPVKEELFVPTIDLTVHFRESPPYANIEDDDWFLVRFRTRQATEGFLEEDGEIRARDGRLLAQSRQLAIVR